MSEVCWAMPDGATGPAIIFQLTRRQRLGSLIVTNSGSNDSLRERGVQNFSVSISDDGATWTPIVNHATLPAARGMLNHLTAFNHKNSSLRFDTFTVVFH